MESPVTRSLRTSSSDISATPTDTNESATTPKGNTLARDTQENTAQERAIGAPSLRRADFGVVHPDLRGIRARRDDGQSAGDYYDFVRDARKSTLTLMNKPVGNQMLREIDDRTAALNSDKKETTHEAPTAVDIYSGTKNDHNVRRNGFNLDSMDGAFRYDGIHGKGQASRITYNDKELSANRFIGEGHEMVHAWRAAHGVQVSSTMSGTKYADPLFKQEWDDDNVVRKVFDNQLQLKEEFETVGLQDTPRLPNAPTENKIRKEHSDEYNVKHTVQNRNDYSGLTPADKNVIEQFKNINEATDDRNMFTRLVMDSPAEKLRDHYIK
jgi:hypothetical protein